MVRGILSQSIPLATTLTDVYTVPNNSYNAVLTGARIKKLVVTNIDTAAHTFRISLAINGAADLISQYIANDVAIPANSFLIIDLGDLLLNVGDVIRCYTDAQKIVFQVFGEEVLQ